MSANPTSVVPSGAQAAAVTELRAAVVGAGMQGRSVAEILVAHDWHADLHDGFEALAERGADGVLLIRAERPLVEATRELEALARDGARPVAAVVVCDSIRPGEVRVALAGGVTGVVLADSLAALVPSVVAVLAGQVAVPRAQTRQVEAEALSPREKQILGLVVMGYRNSEIAEQLVVAESTVKSHLSSAFGKLGVRSRSEAVDLILDSERGLGIGILALGGEPIEAGGSRA